MASPTDTHDASSRRATAKRRTTRATAKPSASPAKGSKRVHASKQVTARRPRQAAGNGDKQAGAQVVKQAKDLAHQTVRTASALAREGTQRTKEVLGKAQGAARTLARQGGKFVREHPVEAAGLAAAGLTVVAAAMGRGALTRKAGATAVARAAATAGHLAGRTGKALTGLGDKLRPGA